MKDTVWNRVTKNIVFCSSEAEARQYVEQNNYVGADDKYTLVQTYADTCSNCGGGIDATGWCPNYCLDSET